jgi:regulator of sirC expression with transglutaminase-like and TPR domain
MTRLRDELAAVLAAGDSPDLGRAALTIARIGYPELDPAPYLAELDALAAAAAARVPARASDDEAVRAVAGYLFRERGFRGNEEDYYDPRNSFLNDVLIRRIGIPITLAVVLIETSTRIGLRVEGVGFPGHFLVRAPGEHGTVLLDPFAGGRVVPQKELLARLQALAGPERRKVTRVPPDAVEPTGTQAILARMLRNLLHIYLERDDPTHALGTVDLLSALVPVTPELLRVRGILYERLDCFAAALQDLRTYLDLAPDAPDAGDIRGRVSRLARAAATLH